MLGVWILVLVQTALAASNATDIFKWNWHASSRDNADLLAVHFAGQAEMAAVAGIDFTLVVDKTNDTDRNNETDKTNETGTPEEHMPRSAENAAFLVLCRNDEVYELLETIQSIDDRYNRHFHHDWVFLNDEPFLDQFVVLVSLFIAAGRISFGQVPTLHWLYPPFIDQQLAAAKRRELASKNVVYAESELYRHMCRYFLGFFQLHPLLAPYDYYWRVEPGVRFYCNIEYDVFRHMRENGKHYGFVLSMFEYSDTIPLLWETTTEHFDKFPSDNESNLLEFVRNPDGSYNLCHFWLNFEIALLAFFRSPQYQQYFHHLDQSGGFFYERWGDAPVHSLAVAHLLSADDVWWFEDMGYLHRPYLHCPMGPMYAERRCACDQSADFSFSDMSCTPHVLAIMNKHTRH